MLFNDIKSIINTKRDVDWGYGQSRRLLVKKDGYPFTIAQTTMRARKEIIMRYRNHHEACYCVSGEGEIEYNGNIYLIKPGTLYAVHDELHILRSKTDLELISVFSPPLKGTETHKNNLENKDGSSY